MSEYIVQQKAGRIIVLRDGRAVRLEVLSKWAEPLFGYGEDSESTRNLGYAILFDYIGEAEANLLYEDFAHEFLQGQEKEISLPIAKIQEFIEMKCRSQLEAQNMRKWQKMKP